MFITKCYGLNEITGTKVIAVFGEDVLGNPRPSICNVNLFLWENVLEAGRRKRKLEEWNTQILESAIAQQLLTIVLMLCNERLLCACWLPLRTVILECVTVEKALVWESGELTAA